MSQLEKRLLVFMISSIVLPLMGLIMAWLVLGPQTIAGLKAVLSALLSVKVLLFLVLFAIAGLIFGQIGLKAIAENMPYSDQAFAGSKYRRESVGALVALIVVVLYYSAKFRLFPAKSGPEAQIAFKN